MKAAYIALFSVVFAYSAYQGIGPAAPDTTQQGIEKGRDSVVGGQRGGAESFPTIGAGICKLTVEEGRAAPCENCQGKGICPATGLAGLLEDHFRAGLGTDKGYLSAHWNVPQ